MHASAVYAVVMCLSGCPSVTPRIVSKRLNLANTCSYTIALRLRVFVAEDYHEFQMELPFHGQQMQVGR